MVPFSIYPRQKVETGSSRVPPRLLYVLVTLFASACADDGMVISQYVPVQDGTRLAVDVHLPNDRGRGKIPALLEFTRYWRAAVDPATGKTIAALNDLDRSFLANGYAVVKVDVRGTGASFGTRHGEYTPTEVRDGHAIVDWLVRQEWCNGNVGAYGTSYSGTTAELLCAIGHPAVKAVVPGWPDFDVYHSPVRPYGVLTTRLMEKWSNYIEMLDNNDHEHLGMQVDPIDEAMVQKAVAEHGNNLDILEATRTAPYRDSPIGSFTYEECSPIHWKEEIERSQVPMLVLASWLDAGTAHGALLRSQYYTNPQHVVIMATNHGGWAHASPFVVSDQVIPPLPSIEEQHQLRLAFFDHYLKGLDSGVDTWPAIRYYNLGEEVFHTTDQWPPADQVQLQLFFDQEAKLTETAPGIDLAYDEYVVDTSVTTGVHNRWATQMGEPVLHMDDRSGMDARMLSYTSHPLQADLQITGSPVISLHLSTSHSDGLVLVYVEDVDEQGRSRYITEGGLQLLHRKISVDPVFDRQPYHSFNSADASPMVPEQVEEIQFELHPTSVLVRKGHSIRVAIAGTDKDTFDPLPIDAVPTYSVHRSRRDPSYIRLPVIR